MIMPLLIITIAGGQFVAPLITSIIWRLDTQRQPRTHRARRRSAANHFLAVVAAIWRVSLVRGPTLWIFGIILLLVSVASLNLQREGLGHAMSALGFVLGTGLFLFSLATSVMKILGEVRT